ncbi:MAG: hypothetical protein E6Q38_01280 [Crocinitomicaceae bacterium]|nr:MAG: hypothetical protein E6Q38_01280 [Crocinitomicaceae bacterium]
MKKLSLIGFVLGLGALLFGLYLMLVIVPAAEIAEKDMDRISAENPIGSSSTPLYEIPEYQAAFDAFDKPVELGTILLIFSIVPFLMCVYPAIKKNLLGILGLVMSLAAFFIAAAYGTHMFS